MKDSTLEQRVHCTVDVNFVGGVGAEIEAMSPTKLVTLYPGRV